MARAFSQPLVVDGLNLVGGTFHPDLVEACYENVLNLSKQKYSPILMVSKGKIPPMYHQKFKHINVYFYTVSGK